MTGLPKRPGCLSPLVFESGDRVETDAQGSDTVSQCSLALLPDPAPCWKFEDTTIQKITLLQCANVSLLVPRRTPRFDTPACHPRHALKPMGDCTIGADVVVTNATGAVLRPTREKTLIDLFASLFCYLVDKTRPCALLRVGTG